MLSSVSFPILIASEVGDIFIYLLAIWTSPSVSTLFFYYILCHFLVDLENLPIYSW